MPSMGYQPSLDGLRALSVIAVIFYHAGFSWMHGGFFGVEVFFVVSGFLITSLLLDERDRSGHTNLPQFWLRRARRLLPALFTVLAAVAAWSIVAGTDEQQSQLRRDLPWAIFYGGNWGQIVGGVPYYSGDPPLLRHVWSLAVEEQWYLVWPLAFVALRRSRLSRAGTAGLLVAISGAVMLWTYVLHGNGPGNLSSPISWLDDVDRINFMYLSTVTRASGLVLGAAAAFVWRPWRSPAAARSHGRLVARRTRPARRGDARLHRRRGDADRWVRVSVATRPRHRAVADRRARRCAPGGDVVPGDPLVAAAGGDRQAQLRHLPLALADLRVRRGLRRFRGAGRRRPRRHRRGVGVVLPLHRDAGAPRRARTLVALGCGAASRTGRRRGGGGRRPDRVLSHRSTASTARPGEKTSCSARWRATPPTNRRPPSAPHRPRPSRPDRGLSSSSATHRHTPWRSTCRTASRTHSMSPMVLSKDAASTTRARCRPSATATPCRSGGVRGGRTSGSMPPTMPTPTSPSSCSAPGTCSTSSSTTEPISSSAPRSGTTT